MLDRPLAGRVFFEGVIRDNLDAGRPDQVSLVFDRRITRRTDSRFRTRVPTDGVIPLVHVDYKHSRIKQYCKEGVALRTETTINDTRDFGIGRRLPNLPALREVGFPPTGASWRCNESAQTRSPEPTPSTRSAVPSTLTGNGSLVSVSMPQPPRRSSPRWWLCACCPTGSPTATCEHSSPHCSASSPAT